MLNSEVTIFQAGLNLVKAKSGARFINGVIRNATRVKHYIQDRDNELDKVVDRKDINALKDKIQKDRIEICEQYTKRDDKGQPAFTKDAQGRMIYDVPDEQKEEFNLKLEETLRERTETLEIMNADRAKAAGEWSSKEAVGLNIYMIPEEYLPEDLKGNELEGIIWMINEMQEELQKEPATSSETKVKKLPTGIKKQKR